MDTEEEPASARALRGGGAGGAAKDASHHGRGMMFLDTHHPILAKYLSQFLDRNEMPYQSTFSFLSHRDNVILAKNRATKPTDLDVNFADFDDTIYRVVQSKDTPHLITVSITAHYLTQLLEKGALTPILSEWKSLVRESPQEGADVTLDIDATKVNMSGDEILNTIPKLRLSLLGCPFRSAFQSMLDKSTGEKVCFDFPQGDRIYIMPGAEGSERVAVTFALCIREETDRAIARVVAQEFVEAKRKVNGAPPCTFHDPRSSPPYPKELDANSFSPLEVTDGLLGYLTFTIFPAHVDTPQKMDHVTDLMSGFRSYLLYHLKASKGYVQMRMRNRFEKMLQVLRRSYVADPQQKKDKKVASGRSYVRK